MKIDRLTLHAVPMAVGMDLTRYVAAQRIDPQLETLVVRLDTACGLTGWGEVCSAPPYYAPALSAGARAGILHVAPLVLDRDPRQVRAIIGDIGAALRGHGNAKTALETALWDLAAKAHGLPLVDLWGGRVARRLPLLGVVRIQSREAILASLATHRAAGYSRFQVKLGAAATEADIAAIRMVMETLAPHERVWFDPNRGWLPDDAMRVLSAIRDLSPMVENPCETYEDCRRIARRTGLPFMLDEAIDGPRRFIQAAEDGVMDVATVKLSGVGGLEAARAITGLGALYGIPMRIEDYYGTGILLACVTHLAQTLPENLVFGLYDYVSPDVPLVSNPLRPENGTIGLPEAPGYGLGVKIDETVLGTATDTLRSDGR